MSRRLQTGEALPAQYQFLSWKRKDINDIVQLGVRLGQESEPGRNWLEDVEFDRKFLTAAFSNPRYYVHLIKYGGKAVGMAAVEAYHGARRVGLLHSVFVDPAHRRRGLARVAVTAVIEKARAIGFTRLLLHTNNPSARKFYLSLGFRRCWVFRSWMRLSLA